MLRADQMAFRAPCGHVSLSWAATSAADTTPRLCMHGKGWRDICKYLLVSQYWRDISAWQYFNYYYCGVLGLWMILIFV